MAKKNNSLIDEIFESDWKFSAALAVIAFVFAFILLPFGISGTIAKILLPTIQFLAKWFSISCAIVSISKLLRDFTQKFNQSQNLDFEKVEPVFSSPQTNSLSKRRKENSVDKAIHSETTEQLETSIDERVITKKKASVLIKDKWTLEFINSLDWNIFEGLCSQYLNAVGVKNNETDLGADGGVDLFIYEDDKSKPIAIAQCKKWSNPMKVGALREFYGVMNQHKVDKGYFFTTDKFYKTAIKFADENNIDLIDGALLISLLKGLEQEKQEEIYDAITTGDYTTPTCVRCGKKMVMRTNKKTQEEFWGCNTYRCRGTLNIKSKFKASKKPSSLHY